MAQRFGSAVLLVNLNSPLTPGAKCSCGACPVHRGSIQENRGIAFQRSLKCQNIAGRGQKCELGVKKSHENACCAARVLAVVRPNCKPDDN